MEEVRKRFHFKYSRRFDQLLEFERDLFRGEFRQLISNILVKELRTTQQFEAGPCPGDFSIDELIDYLLFLEDEYYTNEGKKYITMEYRYHDHVNPNNGKTEERKFLFVTVQPEYWLGE